MKFKLMILCALLTLLAIPAMGQIDPGPDGIGIYADMEAMTNAMDTGEGLVELYVLVTGCTAEGGITAWEMSLFYDGPITHAGYLIPYNHINVGIFPSFSVGNAQEVIPQQPVMHLMTLTFLVLGTGQADIYIRAADAPEGGSLGNDLPVYINETGDGSYSDLRNMYPSSGSVGLPVFRFNGEGPVATDSATWSGVKAMFR
jgi:hypothetical protein